jgi:hypothetical protein
VELSITPHGGFDQNFAKNTLCTAQPSSSREDPGEDAEDDSNPCDPEESEEDIPLAISTARARAAAMTATTPSILVSNTAKAKKITAKEKKHMEPMFVTLVHGDVLLLSGDEFEV